MYANTTCRTPQQWNSLPEINCERVCKTTVTLTSSNEAIVLSVHLISGEAQWNKAATHYVIWLQGGQCCIPGEQKALEEWKGVVLV